ncbi:TPA: retron St85 family effector protein [Serratia liquefaciens]
MDDIRDNFLLCIDNQKLRVKNLPNFIFICGGLIADLGDQDPDAPLPLPKSMRDALMRRIPEMRHIPENKRITLEKIILAEEFQDWLEHSIVENLIDFEIVLADLASAVILVVEGLGAYAELGSFSIIDSISEKLITVVNTNTIVDKSFINLGLLKYLEDNERTLLKYKWGIRYSLLGHEGKRVNLSLTGSHEEVNQIADVILERLTTEVGVKTQKTVVFDKKTKGHICLLIADLIYIFSALKISEIKRCLNDGFEININQKKIKEYIYTLEKLGYVDVEHSGDTYYIATEKNLGFIKYRYIPDKNKIFEFEDVNDIKACALLYYREHDNARLAVIRG